MSTAPAAVARPARGTRAISTHPVTIMMRPLVLLVLSAVLAGCHSLGRAGPGTSRIDIRSLNSPATLTPALRTAIYRRIDASSADLYFSDLPEARLTDPADDLADAAGSIIHIHYFLEPSPGNTPIDNTACNAALHHVILAPGVGAQAGTQVFGVYGGGGFFYPAGSVGDATFGGTMTDGTHRLIRRTPGFEDLLGPSAINGKFAASRDDAGAAAIQARVEQFLKKAPPAQPGAGTR